MGKKAGDGGEEEECGGRERERERGGLTEWEGVGVKILLQCECPRQGWLGQGAPCAPQYKCDRNISATAM